MEAQEIFDKVATHLLKQGRRSTQPESGEMCAYRGADGTKCAVGVLIPDELYNDMMEGRTIVGLLDSEQYNLPEWMSKNEGLLGSLQSVHDRESRWKDSATMKRALRTVAGDNRLTSDVLEELAFPWESKKEV